MSSKAIAARAERAEQAEGAGMHWVETGTMGQEPWRSRKGGGGGASGGGVSREAMRVEGMEGWG